jgi:hypothetical protein
LSPFLVKDFANVEIDNPTIPVGGQQRRDRQQSKRGGDGFGADRFGGFYEVPVVRGGESRLNEQAVKRLVRVKLHVLEAYFSRKNHSSKVSSPVRQKIPSPGRMIKKFHFSKIF